MEPFLSAISHFCKKLKVLKIDLHAGFDSHEYMLHAWNRFYLNTETNKLYQTHRILDEPVEKYLCEYIARDPKDRPPEKLPSQCHISFKLIVKMDREVPGIIETIGKHVRHIQLLVLDRSKSHVFMDDNKKTEYGMQLDVVWSHLAVSYPSSLVHILS